MTAGGGWRPREPRTITPDSVDSVAAVGTSDDLYFPLNAGEIREMVLAALQEDQAFQDLTTLATVKSDRRARGTIVARSPGVIAGVPFAIEAFRLLDSHITVRVDAPDGTAVDARAIVLFLAGHARALLSAERVALNFMQRLSGIASLTRRYVDAVRGTQARILDTRKTTPGWRKLEKYAVRAGGGSNHRSDLAAAMLIKDNHLVALDGDVRMAVQRARELSAPGVPVEVECETREQVEAAIDACADVVLLDNMPHELMVACVALARGKVLTEASGGVRLETVRRIAGAGVDRISVGALTHSAPALDLALNFD